MIKLEIFNKSYKEDAKACAGSCDGSPEFNLYETEKEIAGTKIVLHINEESKEFLEADQN